jgi:hypothetical protein
MKSVITNWVLVVGVIMAAIYLAPLLIGLIASGILQLLIGILVVYCIVKVAMNSKTDFDKYR